MAIRCGHCQGTHASVADVKACSGVTTISINPNGNRWTERHGGLPSVDHSSRSSGGYGPTFRFASEKQLSLMEGLLTERVIPEDQFGYAAHIEKLCRLHREDLAHPGDASRIPIETARQMIDWLFGLPKKAKSSGRTSRIVNSDVPAGHYAIKSLTGNNDLDFFRVDRPTEGKWAGYIFVKRVIGGKPDAPVRGRTATDALAAIETAGIEDSAVLYGQQIGQCYRCNRHLTDELSRQLGIGPDCRSK